MQIANVGCGQQFSRRETTAFKGDSHTLHPWANGDYVGRWTVNRQGVSELAYDADYGANAEPLLIDFVTRTTAIVEKVRNHLPEGFSEKMADQILGGPLNAAKAPKAMPAA
ncbi:hypothetical protein [Herbaspirillum seropedicae]|uniref:hypothetical protein n=1 Tax=Herbaspirillum seropedicae TaxID=964 RepID=UPI003FCD8B66